MTPERYRSALFSIEKRSHRALACKSKDQGSRVDRQRIVAAAAVMILVASGAKAAVPPIEFKETCAACHQSDGKGVSGAFPALAGNRFVVGLPSPVIDVVLNGRNGMPSHSSLSNAQIASLLTYVRSAWGNRASMVTPAQVAKVRATNKGVR